MFQRRAYSLVALTVTLLVFLVLSYTESVKAFAPRLEPTDQQQDSARNLPTDMAALAGQVKDLQKQLIVLQAQAKETPSPRIIAAGTATFERPKMLKNETGVRVKLSAEIVARLGDDYIVLLTPRLMPEGYPYLIPFWKKTADGIDIVPVDTTLGTGSESSYSNRTNTHIIDWIVVKK